MKMLAMIMAFFIAGPTWLGNFNKATIEASSQHKLILISFSGSDWCGPCIRLTKEIFESQPFEDYASKNLVLVRADFPRQKKNQLSSEQQKENEKLADKYNPNGTFPETLLVDGNGKILKKWDGFPNESPQEFVSEINTLAHGSQ